VFDPAPRGSRAWREQRWTVRKASEPMSSTGMEMARVAVRAETVHRPFAPVSIYFEENPADGHTVRAEETRHLVTSELYGMSSCGLSGSP